MKTLNKVVTVFAKAAEIGCWIACGFLTACLVVVLLGRPDWLRFLGNFDSASYFQLDAFGLSVTAGSITNGAYILFFISSLLSAGLYAMICRNVYLIFKTTAGETRFAKGATPFQPDNIRMVREIGIFMLAVPVIQFAVTTLAGLIFDRELVEFYADTIGIFPGLVILCLSQFFAYGTQLQNDTDGLL